MISQSQNTFSLKYSSQYEQDTTKYEIVSVQYVTDKQRTQYTIYKYKHKYTNN